MPGRRGGQAPAGGGPPPGATPAGPGATPAGGAATARALALEALVRIEEGAYANLVVPALLERSGLAERDRAFATELAYGTTRMRRACDHLVDPFVDRPLDAPVRAALRLGAYQLAFLQTPAHAAVSATVDAAPRRARGLVNAVLRRVASSPPRWPDLATELSYPDWVVDLVLSELGPEAGRAALAAMNAAPPVTHRDDGYVQDEASQEVARHVGARPGERVADLCAAPGGKATLMAASGPALVVASDVRPSRARLTAGNVGALGAGNVAVVAADGRAPALRPGLMDRVLVDAPCSGFGVFRRRPDARWRVQPGDVEVLARLQRQLVDAAVALLGRGGLLVYSVCTLPLAETVEIDRHLAAAHPELEAEPPPGPPWERVGRAGRLLPQARGTDGMYVLSLRRPSR